MVGEPLRRVLTAGSGARRALAGMPGELARRGLPVAAWAATVGPDPLLARRHYKSLAASYDMRTAAGQPYRQRTVERLAARPGELILDIGCGTGLNFAQLEATIGPTGRLIGVDLSPDMLDQARARVERHGWGNVELVEAAAEELELGGRLADAALMCGVHDVMRSPPGLENILRHLRDRGRVVAAGPKWAPWWRPGSVALNLSTWTVNHAFVTTFEGFDRPWTHLAELVADLEVEEVYSGGGYIAAGTWRRA